MGINFLLIPAQGIFLAILIKKISLPGKKLSYNVDWQRQGQVFSSYCTHISRPVSNITKFINARNKFTK